MEGSNSKKEAFVKANIELINSGIKKIVSKKDNPFEKYTDCSNFLKEKFHRDIKNKGKMIFEEWKKQEFVEARIKDIANEHVYYHVHLKKYLLDKVSDDICKKLESGGLDEQINNFVKMLKDKYADIGFQRIATAFKHVFKRSLYFNLRGGFPENLANINPGVMTSNAGDSHQFLFLARAILVGYKCSNVDVRSSRYDVIVDYNDSLYRIQVKGITANKNEISFRDRDRGGKGIDYRHESNRGKRITSKDCDVFVAVDKNTATCYLIDMKWVDNVYKKEKLILKNYPQFKENWDVFKQLEAKK